MVSYGPAKKKQVKIPPAVDEVTPLDTKGKESFGSANDDDDDDSTGHEYFASLKGEDSARRESLMADQLSMRLLAVADDDSEAEDAILKETLDMEISLRSDTKPSRRSMDGMARKSSSGSLVAMSYRSPTNAKEAAFSRLCGMTSLAILGLVLLVAALYAGAEFIGPPNQPVGPYQLQASRQAWSNADRAIQPMLTGKQKQDLFRCQRYRAIVTQTNHSTLYPTTIPATQAVIQHARVPPSIARNPILARSARRSGHRPPIPPT